MQQTKNRRSFITSDMADFCLKGTFYQAGNTIAPGGKGYRLAGDGMS